MTAPDLPRLVVAAELRDEPDDGLAIIIHHSHKFNSHLNSIIIHHSHKFISSIRIIIHHSNFKLRVSNPRNIAYVHFKMPFETSNIPEAGPILPD